MIIDSHAHLNDEKFDNDREDIFKEIAKNGVSVVNCGYSVKTSKEVVELSKKHSNMYAVVGISPNDIPQNEEELWKEVDKIKQIAAKNNVLAIGEIGLDYYWNKENKEIQIALFEKQIEIANKLDLPIVIHSRDASVDTIDVLKKNNVNKKGVFHCCQLNQELIKAATRLGFYISFAGPITFKNTKNAEEIVKLVPIDKILIETDSPYLSPEPLRGRRNSSLNVVYVADKIATILDKKVEEIYEITAENTKKIFQNL